MKAKLAQTLFAAYGQVKLFIHYGLWWYHLKALPCLHSHTSIILPFDSFTVCLEHIAAYYVGNQIKNLFCDTKHNLPATWVDFMSSESIYEML